MSQDCNQLPWFVNQLPWFVCQNQDQPGKPSIFDVSSTSARINLWLSASLDLSKEGLVDNPDTMLDPALTAALRGDHTRDLTTTSHRDHTLDHTTNSHGDHTRDRSTRRTPCTQNTTVRSSRTSVLGGQP